ncbi:SpoIIE family protein phosphatase [Nocardiopsis algeriensis]|uniref:SpoIIE family protein phosphatase n=1 Tax=Nocardiopsis algeriensis TaxID=1478215 RepID=UPI003B42EB3B
MNDDNMLWTGSDLPSEEQERLLPAHIGLGAEPDEAMERFARLAARLLGVPAALVSVVEGHGQIVPGAVGLKEPWASSRRIPLPREANSGAPMDEETGRAVLARMCRSARESGTASCTGAPLTDQEGHVLGFLIAVGRASRVWNREERDALDDLAQVCSAELRLRILANQSREARLRARSALERSRTLLRTADDLAGAADPVQVRRSVRKLTTDDLDPVYVELLLREDGILRRVVDAADPQLVGAPYTEFRLDSAWPSALAVRTGTVVEVVGPAEIAEQSPEAREAFAQTGVRSLACIPLLGDTEAVGVLVLGWRTERRMDVVERALLRSLAEYTARAVQRAAFVNRRVQAARSMQQAMLTELPDVGGLDVEVLYRPAARDEMVGGDWYDAHALSRDPSGTVVFTVGDITGHDIHAAALMGQVRSMLRQASRDHPDGGPAQALTAFERANRALGVGASGTIVHVHLRAHRGGWLMTWSNAGHMPPLVVSPSRRVHRLEEHDLLIHPDLPDEPRTDHRMMLEAGSTLLMFTDGLVEHRGHSMDAAVGRVAQMLAAGVRRPLPALLGGIADEVAGDAHDDDIVMLAVRLADRRPG